MFEQHPGLEAFVWEYRHIDSSIIALSGKKHPGIPVALAAAQIAALQKIKHKIPAWYRPGIQFPSPLSVEQASSEATARFKASLFSGDKMVDLTGGLGVDVFFLAQYFAQVTHVEQNTELQAAVRRNYAQLGTRNVDFFAGDALDFFGQTEYDFDLVYLDPARRHDTKGKVLRLEDCSPNILEIKDLIFEKTDTVLLKTSPMLDVHLAIRQLESVAAVWVIAVEDECREVLYVLQKEALLTEQIPLRAVQIGKNGEAIIFETTRAREAACPPPETSVPLQFIYEPHAALMKLGHFHAFAQQFGLKKLNPFTHLFTADACRPDVPGRVFQLENILKYDRKTVAAALPEGRANVAARNFPDTADAVRQRLGLRDGGADYLFAVTDHRDAKVLLHCRKIA